MKTNSKASKNNSKRAQNLSYRRILFIDRKISEGKYPSAPKLAKEYETSVSTIKRDIEYMRLMLEAPIKYDETKKGYYYTEKTFMLPLLFTDEEDVLAGAIAAKLLTQYKSTPIYSRVKNIFDNFNKVLFNSKNIFSLEKRILFIEEITVEFSEDIWNTLMTAIHENKYVDFSYQRVWDNYKGDSYHIAPYQMVCKSGVWYLAGYSKRKNSVSLYALNRMDTITITDEIFEMPTNYQYLNPNEQNLGVFSYENKLNFEIHFFNETANYMQERKLSNDQVIKRLDDGSVIIKFSSGQLQDVLRFILSQGANAKPLKPKQLVESWKNHILAMYENIEK